MSHRVFRRVRLKINFKIDGAHKNDIFYFVSCFFVLNSVLPFVLLFCPYIYSSMKT
jgi:hypothetical protein